jgi:hypothetical protein
MRMTGRILLLAAALAFSLLGVGASAAAANDTTDLVTGVVVSVAGPGVCC